MRHRHHRRHSLATILLIIVSGLLIAAIAGWAIVEEGPDWLVVDGLYKPRAVFFLGAVGVVLLISGGLWFGLAVRKGSTKT
jgi:hypothetical protein